MRPAYVIAVLAGLGALLFFSRRSAAAPQGDAAPFNNLVQDILTVAGPRGIRNNNPLNIRHGSSQWQGMSPEQTDPEFVQFIAPEWGIRAAAVTLRTYRNKYGLNTLAQIIARWAPPTENNTEAYIRSVSSRSGIAPDQVVTDADLPALLEAMTKHENGIQPYTLAQFSDGVSRA